MLPRALFVAGFILAVTASQPGLAKPIKNPVYTCYTKETMQPDADGGFKAAGIIERTFYNTFTFDEASGRLQSGQQSEAYVFELHQGTSSTNNLLASRQLQGSASFVLESLIIKTWDGKNGQFPFVLHLQHHSLAGVCTRN